MMPANPLARLVRQAIAADRFPLSPPRPAVEGVAGEAQPDGIGVHGAVRGTKAGGRAEPSAWVETRLVMSNNETKQNQHSVPRLVLRNFASNGPTRRGKEKIWAFDKRYQTEFNPNIKKIAAQIGYYESELLPDIKLENGLSYIESAAADAVTKIVEQHTLSILDFEERASLAIFCAAQFLRVQAQREQVARMNSLIEKKIIAMGGDPKKIKGWSPMSEEEIKAFSIQFLATNLTEFANQFVEKIWLLMETPPEGGPFISAIIQSRCTTQPTSARMGTWALASRAYRFIFQ